MFNLIKADFYKINRSMIYKVLFLIAAISAVTTTLVSHFVGTGDMEMSSAGSAALLTDVVMLNLLGSVVAGQLICGDFENKLIQSAVAGCSGRGTLVCAKMITYTLLIGLITLPYALCAVVGYASGAAFGAPYSASVYLNILFETNTVDFSVGMLLKYIAITAIMALAYTAQTSFVFFLAFVLKNKALIVTAAGFLTCTLIGMTSSLLSSSSETVEKVISYTPFSADAYNLNHASEIGMMLKVVAISVVFIAVFTGLSIAAFRKTEIK